MKIFLDMLLCSIVLLFGVITLFTEKDKLDRNYGMLLIIFGFVWYLATKI